MILFLNKTMIVKQLKIIISHKCFDLVKSTLFNIRINISIKKNFIFLNAKKLIF